MTVPQAAGGGSHLEAGDDAACRQQARQLRTDHPGWVVIWLAPGADSASAAPAARATSRPGAAEAAGACQPICPGGPPQRPALAVWPACPCGERRSPLGAA
jgi:hypothetical protein